MITSTVGFPRLSKIWRALMHLIVAMLVAIGGEETERASEQITGTEVTERSVGADDLR